MKEENCVYCYDPIPVNACQQGQLIDGNWFPLHVGCADGWCNEAVEVFIIIGEDYGYTCEKESLIAEIDHLEDGQELRITKGVMPRIDYLTLPEANI